MDTAAVYADLMSSPSSGGHAPTHIDASAQLLVIGVALAAIFLIGWLWPSSKPFAQLELLWTVAPRENDRVRIRRLILPAEALDFSEPAKQRSEARDASSSSSNLILGPTLLQLTESVGAVLSPAPSARQQPAWDHSWTFRTEWTQTEAARDCTPLLVFINRGSGGRQGEATLVQLRALLSHHQVVDLSQGHAEQVLQSFRSVRRFRVLVCGGDGTVGWVLSLLDTAGLEYTPPVAILPLGTGNDLARALGWGGRHPGRDFIPLLEEVDQAQVALLDRWQVEFPNARVPKSLAGGRSSKITAPEHSKEGGQARKVIMQNYLGVGVDAKVALEWHRRRQYAPQKFNNVLGNKARYAMLGAKHILRPKSGGFAEMCAQLTVVADGVELELPPGTEGIIVLNIASYGGTSSDNSADEWEGGASTMYDALPHFSDDGHDVSSRRGGRKPPPVAVASGGFMSESPSSGSLSERFAARAGMGTPPAAEGFVPASMDDGLLEVVVVEGVLQLGLAQMSLTNARRLCQCRSITITSSSAARLPLQVDGEPFEVEPMFAPRKPLSISISHYNQAVMLSRSRVRSDGVALEAIDWAMQEGVLSVEQRNKVVREIARRTGSLQRRALSSTNFGGSNLSLPSLANLG